MVVELPGVDPETVHVIASDRTLVVSGERKRPRAGKGGQVYQQMEIDYGPFERTISLTEDVETENGTASYEQGLLKIVFPIAPAPGATRPSADRSSEETMSEEAVFDIDELDDEPEGIEIPRRCPCSHSRRRSSSRAR